MQYLIGNKADLEENREVSTNEGKQLADQLSMRFLETSAKMDENIEKSFYDMAVDIVKDLEKRGVSEEETPNITQVVSKRKRDNDKCKC